MGDPFLPKASNRSHGWKWAQFWDIFILRLGPQMRSRSFPFAPQVTNRICVTMSPSWLFFPLSASSFNILVSTVPKWFLLLQKGHPKWLQVGLQPWHVFFGGLDLAIRSATQQLQTLCYSCLLIKNWPTSTNSDANEKRCCRWWWHHQTLHERQIILRPHPSSTNKLDSNGMCLENWDFQNMGPTK